MSFSTTRSDAYGFRVLASRFVGGVSMSMLVNTSLIFDFGFEMFQHHFRDLSLER